jgi:hypothetical protein
MKKKERDVNRRYSIVTKTSQEMLVVAKIHIPVKKVLPFLF